MQNGTIQNWKLIKFVKKVNGQKVIQLSEAARQRLLLIKRNRKGE